MSRFDRIRANIVFEGGGAKGIFHVGALHAIESFNENEETPNLEIEGVGGTSIGALVAALVAVGYSAPNLIKRDGDIPLQGSHKFKIPDGIVGKGPWFFLAKFRNLIRRIFDENRRVWWLLILAVFFLTLYAATFYTLSYFIGYIYAFWLCTTILALVNGLALYGIAAGLVSLRNFKRLLNQVLAEGATDDPEKRAAYLQNGFKFGDLKSHDHCCHKLRIVATDASNGRMKLFSELETPDVDVADAVVASMSIPGIVQAHLIDDVCYFDGGIVSNRPAWAFNFEHTFDPDLETILIGIGKTKQGRNERRVIHAKRKLSLFFAALYAGIIGENSLETKKSSRVKIVSINPANVGVLDFDMTREQRRAYIEAGHEITNFQLVKLFVRQPVLFELAAKTVKECLLTLMKERSGVEPELPPTKILFAERIRSRDVLKVVFSSGELGVDTDDRLLLPIDSTSAGSAYKQRCPIPGEKTKNEEKQGFKLPRDRYRKTLKMSGHNCTLNVPVLSDDPSQGFAPVGVVIIESEAELGDFGLDGIFQGSNWMALQGVVNSAFNRAYRIKYEGMEEPVNA